MDVEVRRDADNRGESGKYAHTDRQSTEPVSVWKGRDEYKLFFAPDASVQFDIAGIAAALDLAALFDTQRARRRAAGQYRVREGLEAGRNKRGLDGNGYKSTDGMGDAVRDQPSGSWPYLGLADTVCAGTFVWTDLEAGDPAQGRLFAAWYVYGAVHFYRKSGENSGIQQLFTAGDAGAGSTDRGICEPGHEQCTGSDSALWFYGSVSGADYRNKSWRTWHTDCIHGKPDQL